MLVLPFVKMLDTLLCTALMLWKLKEKKMLSLQMKCACVIYLAAQE